MSTIPTTEPTEFPAGDTVTWEIALADYPASSGWTLKYRLLSSTGKIDITSTANGANHLVAVSAATSAVYPVGDYAVQKYVTKGAERHTLPGCSITITPDLAAATVATDTRTHNKRVLDAIDAVIEGRASETDLQTETTMDGDTRRLSKIPHADLLKLRGVYGYRVYRELNRGQIAPRVRVSFGGIC